jgi:hypothetical protein
MNFFICFILIALSAVASTDQDARGDIQVLNNRQDQPKQDQPKQDQRYDFNSAMLSVKNFMGHNSAIHYNYNLNSSNEQARTLEDNKEESYRLELLDRIISAANRKNKN